jgi:hypothetical protein
LLKIDPKRDSIKFSNHSIARVLDPSPIAFHVLWKYYSLSLYVHLTVE